MFSFSNSCLVSSSSMDFELNRKDTPCEAFLVSQKPDSAQRSIAVGLLSSRGMFRTPNPTPPSSKDSSPANSPLWGERATTSFVCCTGAQTLTVPSRAPHHVQHQPDDTNFNFDVTTVTLDLSGLQNRMVCSVDGSDKSSHYESTGTSSNDSSLHYSCTTDEPITEQNGSKAEAQSDCCEIPKQRKDPVVPRPLELNTKRPTASHEPGRDQIDIRSTKFNGLLRRYSDAPISKKSNDKLVLYFRASQSVPPTPHNT